MLKFLTICVCLALLGLTALIVTGSGARSGFSAGASLRNPGHPAECHWTRAPRPPFDQRWRCI